jgi:hypothetical protein
LVITLLVVVCSALGLPFYVASTVLGIMHVDALKIRSVCETSGETQKTLGVK